MGRLERTIMIRASPDKVWEMLAFDAATEWMGDLMTSAEYTSEVRSPEDKFRVGATAHASTHSGMEYDLEITESIRNEKMTSRASFGSMTSIGTYSLKPTESGTEVTYVMAYEWSSLLGKIFEKLVFGKSAEKESEKGLEKLKSILEK